jgi:hypothetical protein
MHFGSHWNELYQIFGNDYNGRETTWHVAHVCGTLTSISIDGCQDIVDL